MLLQNLRNQDIRTQLISAIVEFFQIKLFAKKDAEVRKKLLEFCGHKEEAQVSERKLFGFFSPRRKPKESEAVKNSAIYPLLTLSQDASLDTVLLNLLFHYTDSSLKEKIINLLLSNFDFEKSIIASLEDIVLLPPGKIRTIYLDMKNIIAESAKGINRIKYLNSTVLVNGITQENPAIATILSMLTINFTILKSYLTKKNNSQEMLILQQISKNLSLHQICIKLFADNWP